MLEVVVTRRGEVSQDVMDKECHPGVVAIAADVTDQVRMEAVVKEVEARFGIIKTLIYNAGSGVFKKYDSLTVAELEKSFAINTSGLLIAAKLCAPRMIEAGGGVIGITGATAALRGKPFTAGFAPAKAAQRMMAQSLARDLGPQVIQGQMFGQGHKMLGTSFCVASQSHYHNQRKPGPGHTLYVCNKSLPCSF